VGIIATYKYEHFNHLQIPQQFNCSVRNDLFISEKHGGYALTKHKLIFLADTHSLCFILVFFYKKNTVVVAMCIHLLTYTSK